MKKNISNMSPLLVVLIAVILIFTSFAYAAPPSYLAVRAEDGIGVRLKVEGKNRTRYAQPGANSLAKSVTYEDPPQTKDNDGNFNHDTYNVETAVKSDSDFQYTSFRLDVANGNDCAKYALSNPYAFNGKTRYFKVHSSFLISHCNSSG